MLRNIKKYWIYQKYISNLIKIYFVLDGENMEYEVRFYYSKEDLMNVLNKFSNVNNLEKGLRTYEKTIQYNHCDERHNFYS